MEMSIVVIDSSAGGVGLLFLLLSVARVTLVAHLCVCECAWLQQQRWRGESGAGRMAVSVVKRSQLEAPEDRRVSLR